MSWRGKHPWKREHLRTRTYPACAPPDICSETISTRPSPGQRNAFRRRFQALAERPPGPGRHQPHQACETHLWRRSGRPGQGDGQATTGDVNHIDWHLSSAPDLLRRHSPTEADGDRLPHPNALAVTCDTCGTSVGLVLAIARMLLPRRSGAWPVMAVAAALAVNGLRRVQLFGTPNQSCAAHIIVPIAKAIPATKTAVKTNRRRSGLMLGGSRETCSTGPFLDSSRSRQVLGLLQPDRKMVALGWPRRGRGGFRLTVCRAAPMGVIRGHIL